MRKGAQSTRRIGDADLLEQLDGAAVARGAVEPLMQAESLLELEADSEARVEAGRRLLEDHRQVLADKPPPLARRERQEIPSGEGEAVGRDLSGIGDEPHQSQHGHALARARFADDAEHLAFLEPDIDVVHRMHHPGGGREVDGEVLDVEQRHVAIASASDRRRRASRRPAD